MASHDNVSGRAYVMAWLGLLALTALSFGISYLHLGALGTALSLGIAGAKTVVVMLFFMHLVEAPFPNRFIALVTFLFIVLLSLGMAADVGLRR